MEYHMIPPADDYYKNQSKNKNSLKALESIQKQKPEKSLINTHTHTHTTLRKRIGNLWLPDPKLLHSPQGCNCENPNPLWPKVPEVRI